LSILVFAESPEHGLEIGFVRQLSDSVPARMHRRQFSATIHIKASINKRFYISSVLAVDRWVTIKDWFFARDRSAIYR